MEGREIRFLTIVLFLVTTAAIMMLFMRIATGSGIETLYKKSRTTVVGSSMEPTLYDGDVVKFDRSYEALSNIERGDIIIHEYPDPEGSGETLIFVKRVVALSGDEVIINGGHLYVNGLKADHEGTYEMDFGPYVVEDDAVFVLGDNSINSYDSRFFENPSLPIDMIIGSMMEE